MAGGERQTLGEHGDGAHDRLQGDQLGLSLEIGLSKLEMGSQGRLGWA